MKKKLVVLIIVILISGIAFYLFYSRKDQKDNVVRTSGIVEGIEVNLSAKVAGRISEICCDEGDTVKEGRVIIKLESEDLQASVRQAVAVVEKAIAEMKIAEAAIENSKANIQNAEAEIKNAEADIQKSKVQMDHAKKELERIDALYKEELVSKSFYDNASADYETAVAALKSSEARLNATHSKKDAAIAQLNTSISQLSSSKARIKESEASLAFYRSKLNDTIITTSVSGTVIFKALEKGETVTQGTTIVTIVDLYNLYIRADIEETMIGNIALGSEAVIKVEGIPDRIFKGRVSEIGRYAEFATQRDVVRGRQDIKTFRVKIKVAEHEGLLKPGLTVSVEIPKKE